MSKSHKGIKKRLKISKNGKIMHRKAGKRHLLAHKSSKRKRHLRRWEELNPSEQKKLKKQYDFE